MVELKLWIIPIAALIPLAIGFIWYNPKVLGTAWMNEAGMTEEKMKGGKMGLIFFLSYVFACLIGMVLAQLCIHQMGFNSMVLNHSTAATPEFMAAAKDFLTNYGQDFRNFKHGAVHGVLGGFFFAFPLLATNALFERKSWKYIWINTGYWVISMTLMSGVICEFV